MITITIMIYIDFWEALDEHHLSKPVFLMFFDWTRCFLSPQCCDTLQPLALNLNITTWWLVAPPLTSSKLDTTAWVSDKVATAGVDCSANLDAVYTSRASRGCYERNTQRGGMESMSVAQRTLWFLITSHHDRLAGRPVHSLLAVECSSTIKKVQTLELTLLQLWTLTSVTKYTLMVSNHLIFLCFNIVWHKFNHVKFKSSSFKAFVLDLRLSFHVHNFTTGPVTWKSSKAVLAAKAVELPPRGTVRKPTRVVGPWAKWLKNIEGTKEWNIMKYWLLCLVVVLWNS